MPVWKSRICSSVNSTMRSCSIGALSKNMHAFTLLCIVDSTFLINWTSPFPNWRGVWCFYFEIEIIMSRQCRPWSDAVFCSVLSGPGSDFILWDTRHKWINKVNWAATWQNQKMAVRPAKTRISLGIHPVWTVFAVGMKKAWVLSYPLSAQPRLWLDWADAQANPSLC